MSDNDREPVPLDYRPPEEDRRDSSEIMRQNAERFWDAIPSNPLTPALTIAALALAACFFDRPHLVPMLFSPIVLACAIWYVCLRIRLDSLVIVGLLRRIVAIVAIIYWVWLANFPNQGYTIQLWRNYSWGALEFETRATIVTGLLLFGIFGVLDLVCAVHFLWSRRANRH